MAVKTKKRKTKGTSYFDYSLLAVIIVLVCFGLVMLYSTSSFSAVSKFKDSMYYLKKQIGFDILGFLLMFVASKLHYRRFAKVSFAIYCCAIIMMLLVQTPLGIEVNGARRWLRVPVIHQFQPSEIAKIAVITYIPCMISKAKKVDKDLLGKILLAGGLQTMAVYFLTENLSTALIVAGISFALFYIVHPKDRWFKVLLAAGIVGYTAVVLFIGKLFQNSALGDNFRMRRVIVWLAPEQHASDWGYQVMQGLYAIGSGGFFGKGLGNSVQKMVIPEVQNDMILSIVCEELGVFGALIILTLFGFMLYRLVFIAQNAPDQYSSLVVTGIFVHIALQVILNVAVVINMIPTTGITLPFVSYGGTSTLFLLIEMGIALSVSSKIKIE